MTILKRGRKPTEVYYKSKQPDNVSLDSSGHIILKLPISLEDIEEASSNSRPDNHDPENLLNSLFSNQEENDLFASFIPSGIYKKDDSYDFTINSNKEEEDINENIKDLTYSIEPQYIKIESLEKSLINEIKTSICCWWCCHSFDTFPIPIPVSYSFKKNIFKVRGVCCSFNCCISYIHNNSYKKNTYLCKQLYCHLYKKNINSSENFFNLAPPRESLKMFGGHLNIEEFRNTFKTLSKFTLNSYPVCFVPTSLQQHKAISINASYNKNLKEPSAKKLKENIIENVEKNNSKKRIKKENSPNTLQNLMGLTIKYSNEN